MTETKWAAKNVFSGSQEWVFTVYDDGSALVERSQTYESNSVMLPAEVISRMVRDYENLRIEAGS